MNMNEGNYSAFNYGADQSQPTKTSDLYGNARAAFIQKVYTFLSIQILCTIMFVLLSMFNTSFFLFQVNNQYIFYIALVVCIVIQLYMFCCGGGRTSPSNYICIGLFTLAQSYIVSFASSITGKQSGNSVVLLAGIYTLAIVVALTFYACTTKQDFTTSFGIIIVLTVCLLILAIITMFTSSPFLENLYCCVGVLLFGLYLVIDTQMIIGGKSVELSIDEYALAAMLLYIDIIQIFLYILRMVSSKD